MYGLKLDLGYKSCGYLINICFLCINLKYPTYYKKHLYVCIYMHIYIYTYGYIILHIIFINTSVLYIIYHKKY